MRNQNMGNPPPVEVGQEYEVEIVNVGAKGDGVSRINGYVLFVPKVSKGDKITVRVTKTLPKYGFAEKV